MPHIGEGWSWKPKNKVPNRLHRPPTEPSLNTTMLLQGQQTSKGRRGVRQASKPAIPAAGPRYQRRRQQQREHRRYFLFGWEEGRGKAGPWSQPSVWRNPWPCVSRNERRTHARERESTPVTYMHAQESVEKKPLPQQARDRNKDGADDDKKDGEGEEGVGAGAGGGGGGGGLSDAEKDAASGFFGGGAAPPAKRPRGRPKGVKDSRPRRCVLISLVTPPRGRCWGLCFAACARGVVEAVGAVSTVKPKVGECFGVRGQQVVVFARSCVRGSV